MTDLTVRRRAGLMALLAAAALLFAVAYAWVYTRSDDGRALAVAAVLAVVGGLQAWAWHRARQPMLVADPQGVRTRVSGAWVGLTWADVERVEVSERGPIRDGRIAVVARNLGSVLETAGPRARVGAWLNRRMYGEPLVTPYGLTTTVSAVDPAAAFERLSGGLVVVLRLGDLDAQPTEPAVVVTPPVEPSGGIDGAADSPAVETTKPGPVPVPARKADVGRTAARSAVAAAAAGARKALTVAVPSTTAGAGPAAGLAAGTAADRPVADRPAARREEVTVAGRAPFGIVGGLALAGQDEPTPEALPEIEQLRRRPESVPPPRGHDNVSLIIDATTDLSARAMSKVRRAQAAPTAADATAAEPAETPWSTVIGDRVRGARLRAGLDVDELAERTRIRPYVIESMEADDFAPCGGDFYARGHLRTLARSLNADGDEWIADYDTHFATSPVSPREVFEVELATGGSRLVRGGERSANWTAIVAAVLVLALIWGLAKFLTDGHGQPGELSTPTRTATGLGSPGPGNPPATGPVMATVKVQVGAADTRVVVRDRFKQIVFEGVLPKNSAKKFEGEAPLRVMAADGGDVTLSVKGKSLGVMGDPGQRARERVSSHPR
jgi:Helix-turn-helix domain/RodZ C-terminal domain